MIVALNPQPLPPRHITIEAAATPASNPEYITPIGPRGCPTCTSGIFRAWGDSVVEWTVPAVV